MRWRRTAAWVVVAASAAAAVAALASTPAAAQPVEDDTPCVLDPDTGGCMPDRDRDGRQDTVDNCPDHYNPGQEDNDGDSVGNACDATPNGDPPPDGGGGGGGDGGGGTVPASNCGNGTAEGAYLYEHFDYQGACWRLTADAPNPDGWGPLGNNQTSSVRIVGNWTLVLFACHNYATQTSGCGRSIFTSSSPNTYSWTIPNDSASSAHVYTDLDRDTVRDTADNCPDYYSPDNRCDADTSGSVEEDEGGVVDTSPAASSATDGSVASGCHWRRIGRKHHNVFYRPLVRYNLRVDWCWNASVITSVNVRVWPEVLAGCCWRFNRHLAYDVYDTAEDLTYYANWGRAYFKVFVQGEFQLCFSAGIDLGCPRTVYPWIELTAHRGGTSTKTSGGTR